MKKISCVIMSAIFSCSLISVNCNEICDANPPRHDGYKRIGSGAIYKEQKVKKGKKGKNQEATKAKHSRGGHPSRPHKTSRPNRHKES